MKKPVKKTVKHTTKPAKHSKAKKPAAKPHYTAAQNASFKTWVKHHPFKNTPAKKTTTTKRTLTLNGDHVKLGRLTPHAVSEKPRLVLDKYLSAIDVPAVVDYASEVIAWPMYGNDIIGDCDEAMHGHALQAWTRYVGAEVTLPEAAIVQLYSAVTGYDPAQTQPDGSNPTDQGTNMQDALTYLRKSGFPGGAGHKILAFAQLNDLSQIHQALYMFGTVLLGINFPSSAMDQFDKDEPWTVVQGSSIEGGHAIPLQYSGTGDTPYQVVTWGKLQAMDQDFLNTYVEEAWVVITSDWLDQNGHTPDGLDLAQLGADLASLTGEPNPFPSPAPAPPAPTPTPAPPAPVPAPVPVSPAKVQQIIQDVENAAQTVVQDVEKIL